MNSPSSHTASEPWSAFSGGWSQLGSPLRPSPEDLQRFHRAWLTSLPNGIPRRRLEILSLGVTPEIAQHPWAADLRLIAIDASKEMIEKVWPGDDATRKAVLGNWLAMPFEEASVDLILNDAGLLLMAGAEKLQAAAEEFRRVLRPDGRVVLRHFARVSPAESPEAIAQAVDHGDLTNFNELKLRLLMAIEAGNGGAGVRLAEAHEYFQRLFPDRAQLAHQLGCNPQTVATIDAYRGREARYTFHSLDEMAEAFDAFTLQLGPAGHYPAAERCPVMVFAPKP